MGFKSLDNKENIQKSSESFFKTMNRNLIIGYGPGSSVGIVTGYGLDGPGIESR